MAQQVLLTDEQVLALQQMLGQQKQFTEEQEDFLKLLNVVNKKLMFAYLDAGCVGEELQIMGDKYTYPESWQAGLKRMQAKGVITGYFVGNQNGQQMAFAYGFNPNVEYFNKSRANLANYWLDVNNLETLTNDDFKFERVKKVRSGNPKFAEIDKEFKEADEKAEIQKAEIKKAEIKKAA